MTGELHVTRIAHSRHLIELGGRTILTDPWFTVTPTCDPGEAVARSVAQLPGLDAVAAAELAPATAVRLTVPGERTPVP